MTWLRACSESSCVEVAIEPGQVIVRDSKDTFGPRLTFTHAEWAAFLDGARAGQFDLTATTKES